MLFDSGADLNLIGGDNDVGAWVAVGGTPALQVFIDEQANEGAQAQSYGPNHQQTRAIHSTPLKAAETLIRAVNCTVIRLLCCAGQKSYWMELATFEKTLFAFEPMSRTVPTTITRITANMTAYSAISWPSSSRQSL
jgi:hypothetical protein